jgi:hypothetical protein
MVSFDRMVSLEFSNTPAWLDLGVTHFAIVIEQGKSH